MKKFVAITLTIIMIVNIGVAAYAAFDEETEMIDYDLICSLLEMGMKPNYEVEEDGFVWTRSCELNTLLKELDEDCFVGEGTVYMMYSVYDDIGTLTITGNFTYDETNLSFYQVIFRYDEDYGGIEVVTDGIDEIFW